MQPSFEDNSMTVHDFRLGMIGPAIQELRESLGVSQLELAERLQWELDKLVMHETNQAATFVSDTDAIALALGQHPNDVLIFCVKRWYPTLVIKDSRQ